MLMYDYHKNSFLSDSIEVIRFSKKNFIKRTTKLIILALKDNVCFMQASPFLLLTVLTSTVIYHWREGNMSKGHYGITDDHYSHVRYWQFFCSNTSLWSELFATRILWHSTYFKWMITSRISWELIFLRVGIEAILWVFLNR